MGGSLDVVPTLWACYAIFGHSGLIRYCHLALCGHKGLSDGVHLKNDIDKIVTVYDNGKSVTVHALYGTRQTAWLSCGLEPKKI